ncbi:MAG: hypothetical protein MJ147_03750 [Clostridia bacterium]|nr:hypothetical protein [Clostridia bacterium]
MFNISRIIFLIAIVAVLVVAVYYIFYSRRINAKIAKGEIEGRRLIDIPSVVCSVIIVALIAYGVIVTAALMTKEKQPVTENRNSFSVIDLSDYTYSAYNGNLVDKDASYAKSYSKESNDGYEKSVSQDGDFTFTVFTRTGVHDNYHPDFFCFIDYTGKKSSELSMYESYGFSNSPTKDSGGEVGSGGGYIKDSSLVIGNINDDDSFKITLSLLDGKGEEEYFEADSKAYKEDKGNFPSAADYALSKSSVVITVK